MTVILRQDRSIRIKENRAKGPALFTFLITVIKYLTIDNIGKDEHHTHSVVCSPGTAVSSGTRKKRDLWGGTGACLISIDAASSVLKSFSICRSQLKSSTTSPQTPQTEEQMLKM